jgi:hypothetical protein
MTEPLGHLRQGEAQGTKARKLRVWHAAHSSTITLILVGKL